MLMESVSGGVATPCRVSRDRNWSFAAGCHSTAAPASRSGELRWNDAALPTGPAPGGVALGGTPEDEEPVLVFSRQALVFGVLLAQTQFLDQGRVTLGIAVLQIGQQALALVDHLQ